MTPATRLRVFFATGEASGELLASELFSAMRAQHASIEADGIGGERLAAAGVQIIQSTAGWASMGPLAAIGKIPKLLTVLFAMVSRFKRERYDLIVFIDFGAFNLRLAQAARRVGVTTPMMYYFPPAAWLDDAKRAHIVAQTTDALTAFTHQRDFYRGLNLPIGYVGHPLVSTVLARAPRGPAPADGGRIALLPGSRRGEIDRHARRFLDAIALLREHRPNVDAVFAASDPNAAALLQEALDERPALPVRIERSAREVLSRADAAVVASGTAVLEAALLEVPTIAAYVLSDAQARIARRIYRGAYITLPNLVLDAPIVPEYLQDAATPSALADGLERLLQNPQSQLNEFARLRSALGPSDALERCARFALGLIGQ